MRSYSSPELTVGDAKYLWGDPKTDASGKSSEIKINITSDVKENETALVTVAAILYTFMLGARVGVLREMLAGRGCLP